MSKRLLAVRASGVLCSAWLGVTADAQEPAPRAAFGARADVVTVDVVVLDRDGRPVRGLTPSSFSLLEDGKPHAISSFEARDLASSKPDAAPLAAVGLPQAEGESADATAPGRTLALIVDDVGLDARGIAAMQAISHWVKEAADPRDDVTLATTSGSVAWTGRIASGRGELLRALARIRCQRPPLTFFRPIGPGAEPPLTEWRAYQLVTGRADGSAIERALAPVIYDWWRRRAMAITEALETFTHEHAAVRGRKPIFVLSQGFIRDDDLKLAETAVDSSQRGNTAIYFLDPRGLVAGGVGPGVPGASSGGSRGAVGGNPRGPVAGGDTVFEDNVFEVSHHIDLAGAEQIAEETGGAVVRDTNDLLGRLQGAIDESSSYYLLGYTPSHESDGRWHKLQVKTSLKHVTVRARRGYYASATPLADAAAPRPQAEPATSATEAAPSFDEPPPSTIALTPPPATPDPSSQARGATPTFSVAAEAITVDVVALDKHGRPVVDLAPSEFTLFEDGRQQQIVGFEQRVLAPPQAGDDVAGDAAVQVATNEAAAGPRGRTLAFLIDDLGIEPLHLTDVAKALTAWLREKADPRDDVTLATTSGDTWWSDTVGEGRADLEAVLARVKGKKPLASAQDAMSDWEAYSIDALGTPIEAPGPAAGAPTGFAACSSNEPNPSILSRVVNRWFRAGACPCDPMNVGASIRSCRSVATNRARQLYGAATLRAGALLGGVERFSLGLSGSRGRKSVIVISEGLLRDTLQSAFERAVDASRRGNTAVSFVDARGLVALPFYGADQTAPPAPGDVGSMTAEITLAETAGGEYMAETTGGTLVRDTNDLAGGVARLADESSAYYLLGYQSLRPLDGRWHKLDVKVSRPGVKVRARRGFFATAAAPTVTVKADKKSKPKKGKGKSLPVRTIDPALAVGGERDGIPLRIAPYVFEMGASGEARVLVAVEVGTSALTFKGADQQRTAQLDITVLGVSRDQGKTVPIDAHVDLGIDAAAVGGWWTFTRELSLPPGAAQIRALVRDSASGRSGLVTQRIDVPPSDAPYMSTPILGDRIAARQGGGQIVPAAHRRFAARGFLYCAYEVYLAPGRELKRVPKVAGGYTLADQDGRVVDVAAPTPIAMALDARIVRVIALPLERLAPGRYDLTLQAADDEVGMNLRARQTFWVEPVESASAKPD